MNVRDHSRVAKSPCGDCALNAGDHGDRGNTHCPQNASGAQGQSEQPTAAHSCPHPSMPPAHAMPGPLVSELGGHTFWLSKLSDLRSFVTAIRAALLWLGLASTPRVWPTFRVVSREQKQNVRCSEGFSHALGTLQSLDFVIIHSLHQACARVKMLSLI